MVIDDGNSNKKTRKSYFNILKNKVHFAKSYRYYPSFHKSNELTMIIVFLMIVWCLVILMAAFANLGFKVDCIVFVPE